MTPLQPSLLPCAHCGSTRVESDYGFSNDDGALECSDCGAGVRYGGIQAWNRRSRPPTGASEAGKLVRSKLFQQFLYQGFWHAHHVDLVWRYNGEDVREEADWLKDLWYAMRGKHD